MSEYLISTEPATGAELWRGAIGDAAAEVAVASAAWPEWAARSVSFRMEALRRFANVVRARGEELADLIARETGKPLWEARTEVQAVIENRTLAPMRPRPRMAVTGQVVPGIDRPVSTPGKLVAEPST